MEMARTVGIGIQDFTELREGNYFYIDKTNFIKEWWESGDSVTLITRPRRFGKTINMSMVEQFFSVDYADRGDLFEGLSIWEEEKYQQLQGTYPVISLSFARVKETDFDSTVKRMLEILMAQFKKNTFLIESDKLSVDERDYVQRMQKDMTTFDAGSSLHWLSEYLYKHYGKKVIILLDEYDTPMQEAYVNGFWDEMVAFTRSLFNSTFKTNPSMLRGIMTGITRVSKESMFSDLNNLKVVTTTSNEYATSFGFTEEEVFTSLEECSLGREKKEVKRWYDGFVFGEYKDIYNPWSILNFLDTGKYDIYWANTSSNRLVSKLIQESNEETKKTFADLLEGKVIRCPIDEQIVYDQLDDNQESIWSLLLASGYLKVLDREYVNEIEEEDEPNYDLTLTNLEVRKMFKRMVKSWFSKSKANYNSFIKAMLQKDVKAMNVYMNRISLSLFSYFDTGNRPSGKEPERFYHGFVLGLLVELQKDYVVTSNRESGFGRYDIMLEPKNPIKDVGVIIEFKVHDPDDEQDLGDTVKEALCQINKMQYATTLENRGVPAERVYKYGFAFEGKKVLIGAD